MRRSRASRVVMAAEDQVVLAENKAAGIIEAAAGGKAHRLTLDSRRAERLQLVAAVRLTDAAMQVIKSHRSKVVKIIDLHSLLGNS